MFNWKKMSLVLLAAVSLLSGCTKSNIVSPEGGTRADDGQPDTEIDKNIKIDWLEVREELQDQYCTTVMEGLSQQLGKLSQDVQAGLNVLEERQRAAREQMPHLTLNDYPEAQ